MYYADIWRDREKWEKFTNSIIDIVLLTFKSIKESNMIGFSRYLIVNNYGFT